MNTERKREHLLRDAAGNTIGSLTEQDFHLGYELSVCSADVRAMAETLLHFHWMREAMLVLSAAEQIAERSSGAGQAFFEFYVDARDRGRQLLADEIAQLRTELRRAGGAGDGH